VSRRSSSNNQRIRTNKIYPMSRILGYDRYGNEVVFSSEPENWFRNSTASTTATPYVHIRQHMLDLLTTTFAFLVGRSSKITCAHSDKIWAPCGPIVRLGLPFILNLLDLAYDLAACWIRRRGAKRPSNETTIAPRMCKRELKKRVYEVLHSTGQDWKPLMAHDRQMRKGGLLWGCPWEPTLMQTQFWLRTMW
jgi:hypothetical protein